ncbi:MAG: hypothetical protein H6R26_3187, partial [Proteobacteria bacterium]|nr:hypothetical protein [Pseudomonadota bacterium]
GAYVLTNSLIYKRLSNELYSKAFSALLFCSGVIVTFKSL